VAERLAADHEHAPTARRRDHRRAAGLEHDELELVELHAVDLDRVVDRIERALGSVGRGQRDALPRSHAELEQQRERWRSHRNGRLGAEGGTGDHVHHGAGQHDLRDASGGDMLERRRRLLGRLGQSDPQLQAVAGVRRVQQVFGRALGVDDATAGLHPVHRAGLDALHDAGGVAMHDSTFEQVGERGQADVRMRAHVVVRAGLDRDRAEVVEEHERPDRALRGLRQQAADGEAAAQVTGLRRESSQLGHGRASGRVATSLGAD